LTAVLAALHADVEGRLKISRESLGHPGTKGASTESVWLELLDYLPQRYQIASAHVVDSEGAFSDQLDVVVFDRQYSPFIFQFEGQIIIPAESVYAVFEAKQSINSDQVAYAQAKVASVRKLHRTSLPIPHAGGVNPPKLLHRIIGGLLTFESDWQPPLGDSLLKALSGGNHAGQLDVGCVAAHGIFSLDEGGTGSYALVRQGKPASAFLFELIARLQAIATVPMIDVRAYARWLDR